MFNGGMRLSQHGGSGPWRRGSRMGMWEDVVRKVEKLKVAVEKD